MVGLLKNTVIRTEPRDNEMNVESNFFPHVEFLQPDFPWRYTPARPPGTHQGILSPWLSLIVLTGDEFEKVTIDRSLLPVISIKKPEKSLPDLEQSWSSAHTQISQEITNQQALKEILISKPYLTISRLLCLRKLKPDNLYHAFLVPSFEAGRTTGLGEELNENLIGTALAWKVNGDDISPDGHNLPVYYHWQFTTSKETGDFESMIKKLETRSLPENIGLHELDISKPFLSTGDDRGTESRCPLVGSSGRL